MTTLERFQNLKNRKGRIKDEVLLDLFDSLDCFSCEELHSRWKGGDFETGHWASGVLREMKWFGKWFKTNLDAKPLVCRNDNDQLYSNYVMNGEASLWMVEFRGEISATMIYDGQPIYDHFRKVDDNTILGIMNGKKALGKDVVSNGKYYYFYLERIEEFPVNFVSGSGYT